MHEPVSVCMSLVLWRIASGLKASSKTADGGVAADTSFSQMNSKYPTLRASCSQLLYLNENFVNRFPFRLWMLRTSALQRYPACWRSPFQNDSKSTLLKMSILECRVCLQILLTEKNVSASDFFFIFYITISDLFVASTCGACELNEVRKSSSKARDKFVLLVVTWL